jgi:hypothetical protein
MADGSPIVLAPGANLARSFAAHGDLMYFSKPGSRDPNDWKYHRLRRGGDVRFRIVNGVWVIN